MEGERCMNSHLLGLQNLFCNLVNFWCSHSDITSHLRRKFMNGPSRTLKDRQTGWCALCKHLGKTIHWSMGLYNQITYNWDLLNRTHNTLKVKTRYIRSLSACGVRFVVVWPTRAPVGILLSTGIRHLLRLTSRITQFEFASLSSSLDPKGIGIVKRCLWRTKVANFIGSITDLIDCQS